MLSGMYPGLADSERFATQPLLWGASVCTYREGAKNSKGLDLHSQVFWKHSPKSSSLDIKMSQIQQMGITIQG